MKKLGTPLRLITLVAVILVALTAGTPQPAQGQMSCWQYCRDVCWANGEQCYRFTEFTCGCY